MFAKEWRTMPNKLTIEDVKSYLLSKNEGTQLLDKEYINQNIPLNFKCSCGKIFKKSWINLHSQKYTTCKQCTIKKRGLTKRISVEDVEKVFQKRGYKILGEYRGNNIPVLCEDEEGYRGTISLVKLRNGSNIEKFSEKTKKEFLIYNLNIWCINNGIDTKVLDFSDKQNWSRQGIVCECYCGTKFETSVMSFLSGKFRCNFCTNRISKYEAKVKNWLNNNKVEYIEQYKIKDCRNKLPLPFDFYLTQYKVLIEVDGEGHFDIAYFNNCSKEKAILAYQRTHENDLIKNNYCKNHKINLVRIPYWEFKNDNYKEILANIIKN